MRKTKNTFLLLHKKTGTFGGQYVTIPSFADRNVISHGTKPEKVLKEAKEKGYANPVIFFVPKKGMAYIY